MNEPVSEASESGFTEAAGESAAGTSDGRHGRRGLHTWLPFLGLVVVALVGLVAFQLGAASAGPPPEDGADVGFARDMQTHHNQAVEMSFIIRDKTADPALRTLAYDIATSQQQQSGQMYGWLVQWGHTQTSSGSPMEWMASSNEHGSHASTAAPSPVGMTEMPGLASPEEMQRLTEATGVDAERQFLTLMLRHHEGGVAMAEAALELAETPEVRGLAQAIVTAQTAEITLLQRLLEQRS